MKLLKALLQSFWSFLSFLGRIFKKPENGLTRRQGWFLWWQHHLPQHALSRFMGFWANLEYPLWLKHGVITRYIKHYQINMREAVIEDPLRYRTFNAFFTRRLKPEVRPIAAATVVSPVDGTISQIGKVQSGKIFQAKNTHYDLHSLLGGRNHWTEQFTQSNFVTMYLAPRDYHRVHMPLKGKLVEMIHVPGHLFSVNPTMVENEDGLFARNERVISIFETAIGPVAVILVGAMIVGSIHTVWCGEVTPPRAYEVYSWPYTTNAPVLAQGAEMGHFQIGSTVIVLLPDKVHWDARLKAGMHLQYGEALSA